MVAESVELHVGRLILESVVHVNVTAPFVIAVFLILPPVAPLPFSVIVFVFAVHVHPEALQLLLPYPVAHVAAQALPLTLAVQ